ncbi:hypothetical protein JAU75_16400 [Ochrobactrum sp. Q0168]|uniref:hypothetical protein n=1 Tax=Ochrobactrum sp. Q0168 TaxID=2793241 RepID=UPI0018EB3D28|nr:hypothetical protein [Ochrobactrum sp. Q0168]
MFSNILYDEVQNFRQHPDLNKALVLHIDSYLNGFAHRELITKLTSEGNKYLLALKTVALCFGNGNYDSLTKADLQTFARAHAIASPNRVSALVDVAVYSGYLTVQRSQNDSRQNLLTPTEKLEQCAIAGLQPYLEPLNLLFAGIYDHLSTDRSAIADISNYVLQMYFQNSPSRQRESTLSLFISRAAGYGIFLTILRASAIFTYHPKVIVSLPFSPLSRTFGVSRSHVQKLFQAAERAGLLRMHIQGGKQVEILPRLRKIAQDTIISSLTMAKIAFDCASNSVQPQFRKPGFELE